ncbi:MAG: serpin family protein [Oscillospiraceae bacterium]|nr:serpin family protein [Oscillospiraceae bacterium]
MKKARFLIIVLILTAISAIISGCFAPGNTVNPPYPKSSIGKVEEPTNHSPSIEPRNTTMAAADLLSNITAAAAQGKTADTSFTESMADFSLKLFKESVADTENSLISPLSVMLALAMTANGAGGDTLAQMEAVLGGGIPLGDLNEYLYSYTKGLPSEESAKLQIANSIWFRDNENRLIVEPTFLQRNADYYSASAYSAAFDGQTVDDINNWVEAKTDGMIDKIIDEIEEQHMLFLINAITFDAEWENMYWSTSVKQDYFTDINGEKTKTNFMYSSEHRYINEDMVQGFIKPYVGGYSFVALLPNEDISIKSYIETLTGSGFLNMIERSKEDSTEVDAVMPKFEYEYMTQMNDALATLGMRDAFNGDIADFSAIGTSPEGNLFVSEVLHKTFISVTERGTRAGAATSVAIDAQSAPMEVVSIRLDRPFIYAIIDDATNLPIFIGTLLTVK